MKKQTYVLGAGFSAYAGLPVISSFLESLENFRTEISRRYDQATFNEFRRVICNGNNIEEAFDTLESKGVIEDIELLKNAIHSVIVAGCERYLRLNEEEKVKSYSKFLKIVVDQNASLVSLNYDTILEVTDYIRTLDDDDSRGIKGEPYYTFDYGVDGWESYSSITDCSSDPRYKLKTHTIPFIKLHGGLNFFFCHEHQWVFYADMTNNSYSNRCRVKGCKKQVIPGIIPPRKVKIIKEFKNFWDKAKAILDESDVITLIGLNLNERDLDFNNLIKGAIQDGSKEVGFINYTSNPNWQDEVDRIDRMLQERLNYSIPKGNIWLNGFQEWISQN